MLRRLRIRLDNGNMSPPQGLDARFGVPGRSPNTGGLGPQGGFDADLTPGSLKGWHLGRAPGAPPDIGLPGLGTDPRSMFAPPADLGHLTEFPPGPRPPALALSTVSRRALPREDLFAPPKPPRGLRIERGDPTTVKVLALRGTELHDWVRYLGNDADVRGIYLQTNNEELPLLDRDLWALLSSFPKVMVASGAQGLGAYALAVTADYRVMVEGTSLSFKATPTTPTPPWLLYHVATLVGHRTAERMLALGEVVPASRALAMGLVDEVVVGHDDLDAAVGKAMTRFLGVPDQGRWMTKDMSRRELFR